MRTRINASTLTRWAAIPLRAIVGYGFIAHGYAKVANGPEHFIGILHNIGVPAPGLMGWTTILVEIAGGLAVLVGAFVPLVSAPMAMILLVAALTVHLPYGFSSIKLQAVTAPVNKNSQRKEEIGMSKRVALCSAALVVVCAAGVANVRAEGRGRTLVVTMTNDPIENRINVYDADTHKLLQSLATHGQGGAGGNARGVRQHDGELIAAVNNGSNTVAVFRRDGDSLKFDKVVSTTSAPVSVDFGNDHMYVGGATTVDSFALHRNTVESLDGTTGLELVGGGAPPNGSTAQVGVINDKQLLVTLKTDPDPGTVDLVSLDEGRVTGAVPTAVSAPQGTLTPFGFAVYRDGTAVITLAHSNQDGLFRNGAFTSVVDAGQAADCWATRVGKYVFTANTGSKTISRLIGTGSHVFVDSQVAAAIATGGAPADIDADAGVLGVIDHGAGQSHLSLFSYNEFGELTAQGTPITVGVADANGVAILSAGDRDRN